LEKIKKRCNKELKRKIFYVGKLKNAAHLLFYKHHIKPGVKGWELKKSLGPDYPKIVELLNNYLSPLNMEVKTVSEEGELPEKPTLDQLDKARFYVTIKGNLDQKEVKATGWRIDDISGLAVAVSHIISQGGKAPREEVEKLLREKLPEWRISQSIDRYIRGGYLIEDENGLLYLDWRSKAEINQKTLIDSLLEIKD
jgi:hypothetical protein